MFTSVRHIFASRRNALITAFIFSGSVNLMMLAIPLYTLQVFESVVPTGSIETLVSLSLMALVAIAALTVLEVVRDRILLKAGLWLDFNLARFVLERSLGGRAHAGEVRQEARQVAVVKAFATGPAITPVFDAPWTPLFLLALFALHPLLGWVGLGSAMLLLVAALWQSLGTDHLQTEAAKANELSERWWRSIADEPSRTLGLGLVQAARRRWDLLADEQVAVGYDLGNRANVIKAFARFVRLVSQVAIFGAGAFVVIKGEATGGVLIASSIIMAKALAPIEQAVSLLKVVSAAWAAGRKLRSLPTLTPAAGLEHAAGGGAGGAKGHIVVGDVAYHYPGRQTYALRGVEFELAPGECLGIIGPNGSGKSALAAILAGAVDPKVGQATLDGVALTRWQRASAVAPIGYFSPDLPLLEGSVHDNIAGFEEANPLSVARAAMRVGVHDLISGLPDGYDTPIAADGAGLSARERRAIGLARAAFGNRRMLVLDDPEAGLDARSERQLARHLAELKKEGVRILFATHQPRLLAIADKVLVLRKGAVDLFGPAHEVAKKLFGGPDANKEAEPRAGAARAEGHA